MPMTVSVDVLFKDDTINLHMDRVTGPLVELFLPFSTQYTLTYYKGTPDPLTDPYLIKRLAETAVDVFPLPEEPEAHTHPVFTHPLEHNAVAEDRSGKTLFGSPLDNIQSIAFELFDN